MSGWIPTTLVVAITATIVTSADAGSCSRENSRTCLNFPAVVNFSSVSTISEQIVSQEPTNQKQQKLTTDPPTLAPYTGPTFGRSLGGQAPTQAEEFLFESFYRFCDELAVHRPPLALLFQIRGATHVEDRLPGVAFPGKAA